MKYLLLFLLVFLLTFPVYADVSVTLRSPSADKVSNWNGIDLKYHFDNDIYLLLGTERFKFSPVAYIADVNLITAGIGFRKQIHPNFKVFGHIAYHNASDSYSKGDVNEGPVYYLRDTYYDASGGSSPTFIAYDFQTFDTYSITLGTEFNYPLSKNVDVGFSLAYRYLELPVRTEGVICNDYAKCIWEHGEKLDLSGFNLGVVANYAF